MKNIKNYSIIGLVSLCLTFQSCEKYFDINPDMRTELNTVEKVAQLLVTAYPNADYILFAEAASDNSFDKGPGDFSLEDISRDSYAWNEMTEGSGGNSPSTYWLDMYRSIAAANHAIETIDDNSVEFGTKGQQYKGEALIARAYAHHMLVNLFSKVYQINGDNSSYGVPYVKTPEKHAFQEYDRGTVASVYKNIEEDLLEGMKLLEGVTYRSPKFHFNAQAANAFAARFYLFKGEYDKVIKYSSSIFPDNNFRMNLRPIAGAMKVAFANFSLLFAASEQPFNLLLANVNDGSTSALAGSRYGSGLLTEAYLTARNVTGKSFYNAFSRTAGDQQKLVLNKYRQLRIAGVGGASTQYTTIQCLFSVDEALMNRAEAYIAEDKLDLALRDLNDFAAVRIDKYNELTDAITEAKVLAFYNTTNLKEGLMNTLLDFKRQAFTHEGIRWFDIIRLGIEVEHKHVNEVWEETFEVLKKDDLRRVFQLPESVSLAGLPKNPR